VTWAGVGGAPVVAGGAAADEGRRPGEVDLLLPEKLTTRGRSGKATGGARGGSPRGAGSGRSNFRAAGGARGGRHRRGAWQVGGSGAR
jgi:hypothetical protein